VKAYYDKKNGVLKQEQTTTQAQPAAEPPKAVAAAISAPH